MPQVKNPRKVFQWRIRFVGYPINPFLFQKVQLPEIKIEEVAHGDANRDVKTAGRISVGSMTGSKLSPTQGSDTWLQDWITSIQDQLLGGGLTPESYWKTCLVDELAEDGQTVLNTHYCEEVWPTKVNGVTLDRLSSDNVIEEIEFSVGTCVKQ